ncbi:MAG: hypothetical protein COW84_09430 [Gammaproteobacteria bacterium CG22_combo_CG10-13_8_21_14_all_40_8]|nr:MAG: hypothetical protein COW84_09430 [Gammaproteobacteria bacterium CG22_combo_CG10-13_8_21_14_all_40_8]
MKSAAIFDFDKTIISHDTGVEFVLYGLKKSPWRLTLALLLSPFALVSFATTHHRRYGNSIFLWTVTCGLAKKDIIQLRSNFIEGYLKKPQVKVFEKALRQINQHQTQQDDVVIISGASKWMVKGILKKIGIQNVLVLGSDETSFLTGMVSPFHCYSSHKVTRLKQYLDLSSYQQITGYSDNPADIPMLELCHKKYVINPTAPHLEKFKRILQTDFEKLHWE